MRFTRASRLVRPGSRPARGRPRLPLVGGGGGGSPFVGLLVEAIGVATNPYTWSFASLSPASGDLAVVASMQGNGVAGAGGTSSSGWTEVTSIDSRGRILYKTLGAAEDSITFDADPNYRNAAIALFRGGYTILGTPRFNTISGEANYSATSTAGTIAAATLASGDYMFAGFGGSSAAWNNAPGTSVTPTTLDNNGVYNALGFKGTCMAGVFEGSGASDAKVFTWGGTNFAFNYTSACWGWDAVITPA